MPAAAFAQEAAPAGDEEMALPAPDEEALPAPDAPEASGGAKGNAALVTATRRERPLQAVPLAVSATDAEAVRRARIRDIADLAVLIPSLRVAAEQGGAMFDIRSSAGIGGGLGLDPAVAVYVDGVYRSAAFSELGELGEIQRVEVLRGPQAVLYGRNAPGGVISVITRAPRFEPGAEVEAGIGSNGARTLRGYVTGPLASGAAASLSAGIETRDGFVRDPGRAQQDDDRDRRFLRGQLLVQPGSAFSLRLIGDYEAISEACCAAINLVRSPSTDAIAAIGGRINDPAMPFADISWANEASSNRTRHYGVSAEASYAVGPITLTSITGWRRATIRASQDGDGSSADLIAGFATSGETSAVSQELRASASILDKVALVLGANWLGGTTRTSTAFGYGTQMRRFADILTGGGIAQLEAQVPGTIPGTFFQPGQGRAISFRQQTRAYSLFGSLDVAVAPRLTLTLGTNFTRERKVVSAAAQGSDVYSGLALAAIPGLSASQLALLRALQSPLPGAVQSGRSSDADWSWAARLAYALGPNVNVYAAWSSGFRPSAFNLSPGRPGVGSRVAQPEDTDLFELGLKGYWGAVSANLTLFRQTVSNLQTVTGTATGYVLSNAQQQSTFGIEFDGLVMPAPGVTLSAAMTYLDARYDTYRTSPVGDLSGRRVMTVPRLAATFGVELEHELGTGRVILRGDFRYETPSSLAEGLPVFAGLAGNQAAIDAARSLRSEHNTLGASLSWALASGLELTLWGRNLLDDRDLTAIFDPLAQPGSIAGRVNAPRTWGLSARLRF